MLTAEVGHRIELLPPVIGDEHCFLLDAFNTALEPNPICMLDHISEPVLVNGVEYVEEVLSIRKLALGKARWHVLAHLGIILEPRVEILHGKFVESGYINVLYFGDLEHHLLTSQDLAKEVLVAH